jgi:hypothetical protein
VTRSWLVTLCLAAVSSGSVASEPPTSCDPTCVNLKLLIATLRATMEGCDKAFPAANGTYTQAFTNWSLLKYRIPGLPALLAEKTPEIATARAAVARDFQNSPRLEQEIQCQGYGGKLRNQELLVPKEMLAPYAPGS